MLTVAVHTGARPSEILNIQKQDVQESTGSVYIRGLKGSRDRDIPLPPAVFKRLLILARGRPRPESRVFPIALRTYQGIWFQYRPAEKPLKSLRHTFAVRLYQRTKDIKLVQIALGHTTLMNTSIYADFVYSQEELRKILF